MPPLIVANEIAFYYPQNHTGLQPVSFNLEAGEGLFISSPSGGGKSTLARCVTGLIPHLYQGNLQGQMAILGQDTRSTPLWQLVNQAGLVFQNPAAQMIASTVEDEIIFGLENLGLNADEIDRRVERTLQRFGLWDLRERSPRTLSGGEQQKLALACITARQPRLLVLDEPLSMLDTTAALNFLQALDEARSEGQGFIICEHRHEYIRMLSGLSRLDLKNNHPSSNPTAQHVPSAPISGVQAARYFDRTESQFAVQLINVQVKKGGKLILSDLSCELSGGRIVAIVGRNGAGKTTLLRAVAGLQPFEGQIKITGNPSGEPDFGMVFQNPDLQLFNATVREEILYRIEDGETDRYRWLLNMLKLQPYEEQAPLLLSEGEKRRVALATSLMHNPKHGILLDEPSLGQDSAHKVILMQLLNELSQMGMLVVMATHDMELAAAADDILLLDGGRLLDFGPAGKILAAETSWQQAGLRLPAWVKSQCWA